jgi:hypothetical protein
VEAESAAADSAGDVFATWLLFGHGHGRFDSRVQGRFAGADGSLGPLVRLTGPGDQDYPQAVLYPDGTALVAWTRLRHTRSRIEAVRTRVRP